MSLEKNSDLPEGLRSGLTNDQQTLVRGMYNALVYEQGLTPIQAADMTSKALMSSGMVYDGKWQIVKDDATVGFITKVDEDKRLVFGWASIIKDAEGKVLLDRQNDFIDDEGELEKSAYEYVLHSRDGGEMHLRKGVSTMVESMVLTKEKQAALGIPEGTVPVGWWIGFRVNDDRVWSEVKKGNYAGFSVHGTGKRDQQLLKDGEFTEVEKNEKPTKVTKSESDTVKVSKRYLELQKKARQNKIATVMREFKAGKLKSSSGEKVTDPKQAMAIAISEQQKAKRGVAKHGSHDQSTHGKRGGKGGRGTVAQRNKRAVNTLADRQQKVFAEKQQKIRSALESAKLPEGAKITNHIGRSLSSGMDVPEVTVSTRRQRVSITDNGGSLGYSVRFRNSSGGSVNRVTDSLDRAVSELVTQISRDV